MNFEHSDSRRMLADMLGRFLDERYNFEERNRIAYSELGFSREIWNELAELGIVSALFDEADGGLGGAGFDIAVVGGAVYAARWVENVREWTRAHSAVLTAMPTWIFSSGPVSGPPFPSDEESVQYRRLLEENSN